MKLVAFSVRFQLGSDQDKYLILRQMISRIGLILDL
jgi:hypothetical protein